MENVYNAKTKESYANIRRRRFQSTDYDLGSRMSFHNAKGVNSSRGHNNHKSQMSMHLITELKNTWDKTNIMTRRNRLIHR